MIFDEAYPLVDSAYSSGDWEHIGGLSGCGNNPAALLSMSGYEKISHPCVDGTLGLRQLLC